jgi:hypothetical protein
MARSPTGTFTLVAGNPVITGTIITSDWANTTMPDIGAALTDSLSRTGQGGMLAPFRGIDGTVTSPAHSFTNFPRSGEYAVSADETRMAVNGVDRMRWREAGQPTQTYDSAAGEWRDLGGGGTVWRYEPTIPATVLAGIGYVTAGGQSTLLPANPLSGEAVSFADLNNDWDETPFTLDGNGNTFSQDGSSTYELNLKGAYAHFAFINNEWVIVNFGRLSDAYGLDLDSFLKKDEPIPDGLVEEDSLDADLKARVSDLSDTGWIALTGFEAPAAPDSDPTRIPSYRIKNGTVFLRGEIEGLVANTLQSILTLPVEARPSYDEYLAVYANTSESSQMLIRSIGSLRIRTGTATVTFINCSYLLG